MFQPRHLEVGEIEKPRSGTRIKHQALRSREAETDERHLYGSHFHAPSTFEMNVNSRVRDDDIIHSLLCPYDDSAYDQLKDGLCRMIGSRMIGLAAL